MKNLFKVHPLTYLIILSILLTGYFNYFIVIIFILLIHDLGHIIVMKLFNYNINKITILPFGAIIDSNISTKDNSIEIFLISIAGIVFQLLLYPLIFFLSRYFLSNITYDIFIFYNKLIIIFNLIPIIPLDGSKILLSILENIFSYKKCLRIINYISIIIIFFLIIYISLSGLNSYLIVIFLLYKTYEEIKMHKYIFNKFLFERTLKKNNKRKVRYIKSIRNIYKNKYNFINNVAEDKVLKAFYTHKS